jgi:hypothetical protein
MDPTRFIGRRCRTTRFLTAVSGRVERFTEGRIRYVTENLGRFLVMVEWDRGGSTVVFPDELEIIDEAA